MGTVQRIKLALAPGPFSQRSSSHFLTNLQGKKKLVAFLSDLFGNSHQQTITGSNLSRLTKVFQIFCSSSLNHLNEIKNHSLSTSLIAIHWLSIATEKSSKKFGKAEIRTWGRWLIKPPKVSEWKRHNSRKQDVRVCCRPTYDGIMPKTCFHLD